MPTLSPLLTRGATTLALTATNGIVLAKIDEQGEWDFESADRLSRPGGIVEKNLFTAEGLKIRGLVRGADIATLRTRLGNLLNVLGDGLEDVLFRVYDDREIRCRVEDVHHEWPNGSIFLQSIFEFTLRSPDPFWRALSNTTFVLNMNGNGDATVVVTNPGDAPAPFIFDIQGGSGSALANVTIVLQRDSPTPTEKLRLGKITLSAGKILRIDTETGQVTDDTGSLGLASALAEYPDGTFFRLAPGSNTLRLRVNGDAGGNNVAGSGSFRGRFWTL